MVMENEIRLGNILDKLTPSDRGANDLLPAAYYGNHSCGSSLQSHYKTTGNVFHDKHHIIY